MAFGVNHVDSHYTIIVFDPMDVKDPFIGNMVRVPDKHRIRGVYSREQIGRMYPGEPPIENTAPVGTERMEIVAF